MTDTRPLPSVISEIPSGLPTGLVLNERYRIEGHIGNGGMGVVYKAVHTELHMPVAIKVMSPEVANDPEFMTRFVREAQLMARLPNHPNVVRVMDFGTYRAPGESTGQPYLVMEYLQGKTLEEQLKKESMPLETALKHIEQVLTGLKVAHDEGIIHRDVKPANIFLSAVGDTVKMLDFGLATGKTPTAGVGNNDTPMGTARYTSPEQARGGPVGPPSDLYSVGAMLYEMVTGSPPFTGPAGASTSAEIRVVLEKHRSEKPESLLSRSGTSKELSDFVDKLLEKSPEARYQTAEIARAEVRVLLRELRERGTVTGVSLDSLRPTQRFPAPTEVPSPLPLTQVVPESTAAESRPLRSNELQAVRGGRGRIVAALGLIVLFLVLGIGWFLLHPIEEATAAAKDPAVAAPLDKPAVAAVEPQPSPIQPPPPAKDDEELTALPRVPAVPKKSTVRPAEKTVVVEQPCNFDGKFREYARRTRADLRTMKGSETQVFLQADDKLADALVEKDCHRAGAALTEMRRLVGAPTE